MDPQNASTEDYLRLLNQHEASLAAWVHSLVRSRADADDILQESRIVLWKHFGSFQPGTNFLAWARKIALNQILNYRRSTQRRDDRVQNTEFIEAVAEELDELAPQEEQRAEALQHCLRKLPTPQRRLIVDRYYEDCDIAELANRTGKTEGATYRFLSRIRKNLNDCITRSLHHASAP